MPPKRRLSQARLKGKEYAVREIIGERKVDGETEYEVWWEDYPKKDATWESADNINSESLITEWKERKAAGEGKRPRPDEVDEKMEVDDGGSVDKKTVSTPSQNLRRSARYKKQEHPNDDDDESTVAQRAKRESRGKASTKRAVSDESDLEDIVVVKTRRQSSAQTPKKTAGGSSKKASEEIGEDEWVIEQVVGDRLVNGVQEYRVKWEGFDSKDNSWVPEPDVFAKNLIHDYLTKKKKKEEAAETAKIKEEVADDASSTSSIMKISRNKDRKRKAGDDEESMSDYAPDGAKPTSTKANRNCRSSVVRHKKARIEDKVVSDGELEDNSNIKKAQKDEFEVEKILDVKLEEGEIRYQVKWAGYPDDETSWERSQYVYCTELIAKFNTERKVAGLPVAEDLLKQIKKDEVEKEEEVKDAGSLTDPKDKDYQPSKEEVDEMVGDDAPAPLAAGYNDSLSDDEDGLVMGEEEDKKNEAAAGDKKKELVVDADETIVDEDGEEFITGSEKHQTVKHAFYTQEEGSAHGEEVRQIGELLKTQEAAKTAEPAEDPHVGEKLNDFVDAVEHQKLSPEQEEMRRLLKDLEEDDGGSQLFDEDRQEEEQGEDIGADALPEDDESRPSITDSLDLMDALNGQDQSFGGDDLSIDSLNAETPLPQGPVAPVVFELDLAEKEGEAEGKQLRMGTGRDEEQQEEPSMQELVAGVTADEMKRAEQLMMQPYNQERCLVVRGFWDPQNNNSAYIIHRQGSDNLDVVSNKEAHKKSPQSLLSYFERIHGIADGKKISSVSP